MDKLVKVSEVEGNCTNCYWPLPLALCWWNFGFSNPLESLLRNHFPDTASLVFPKTEHEVKEAVTGAQTAAGPTDDTDMSQRKSAITNSQQPFKCKNRNLGHHDWRLGVDFEPVILLKASWHYSHKGSTRQRKRPFEH